VPAVRTGYSQRRTWSEVPETGGAVGVQAGQELRLAVQLLAKSADKNVTLDVFINKAQGTSPGIRIEIFFYHFDSSALVSGSC